MMAMDSGVTVNQFPDEDRLDDSVQRLVVIYSHGAQWQLVFIVCTSRRGCGLISQVHTYVELEILGLQSDVPEPMLETSVLLSSHAAFELCLIADLLLLSRQTVWPLLWSALFAHSVY